MAKMHGLQDPEVSIEDIPLDVALGDVGNPEEVPVEFEPGEYPCLVVRGIGRRVQNPGWPDEKPRYVWHGSPIETRRIRRLDDGEPYVLYRKAKWRVTGHRRTHESGSTSVVFKAWRIQR